MSTKNCSSRPHEGAVPTSRALYYLGTRQEFGTTGRLKSVPKMTDSQSNRKVVFAITTQVPKKLADISDPAWVLTVKKSPPLFLAMPRLSFGRPPVAPTRGVPAVGATHGGCLIPMRVQTSDKEHCWASRQWHPRTRSHSLDCALVSKPSTQWE